MPDIDPRMPWMRKLPEFGESLRPLSTTFSYSLDEPMKNAIADSLTPLITQAIQAKGIQLQENELQKITELVRSGLTIQTPTIPGKAAKVSGNVAGSVTVDW